MKIAVLSKKLQLYLHDQITTWGYLCLHGGNCLLERIADLCRLLKRDLPGESIVERLLVCLGAPQEVLARIEPVFSDVRTSSQIHRVNSSAMGRRE